MFNELIVLGGALAMTATCGFALFKGGRAEKMAAGWMFATFVAGQLFAAFLKPVDMPLIVLRADGVLAIALLFISIQYASLWLGSAMLLQSSAFALHSWYLTEMPSDRNFYWTALNVLSVAIIVLLATSTALAWRARLKRRAGEGALRTVVGGPARSALA